MRVTRLALVVLGLAALAAAGAFVAMVLLTTIGGTPDDDPVGRLRPTLPGLSVTTPAATDDDLRTETRDDDLQTATEDGDRTDRDEPDDD